MADARCLNVDACLSTPIQIFGTEEKWPKVRNLDYKVNKNRQMKKVWNNYFVVLNLTNMWVFSAEGRPG